MAPGVIVPALMPEASGETPPSGWPNRRPVEQRRIRDVGRIRRNGVAQDDAGGGIRAGVLCRDRVAQRIARIDDARRSQIDEQRDSFLGIERGQRARNTADDNRGAGARRL